VEDRELEALVLQEPVLRAPRLEFEPVGAPQPVATGKVALGHAGVEGDQPARLVGGFRTGVLFERAPNRLGDAQPAQNST
jgi:hypothetical protein